MTVSAPSVTTADELFAMPDDGVRHELVRGELRTLTKPSYRHGRVAANVGGLLFVHARQTGSGVTVAAETGFLLARAPDTVRAPDAAFISKERAEQAGEAVKYWPGAPDLAVEVVSPNDTFHEVQDKAHEWLTAGVTAVLVSTPPNGRRPSTGARATRTYTRSGRSST
jgi:Uma2 family endonuclease